MRALLYFIAIGALTAWHGGRVIGAALFRVPWRRGGVYDTAPRAWGRALLAASGIRVRVEGRERIPSVPAVYIANHVSFVDIWVLLQELPGSLRFVFKQEMMGIPVLGQALRAGRHISIDRKNQAKAFAAYDDAAKLIQGGISAAVFAEGTRSPDGTLRPFKKGPFVLAVAAGAPIVPVHLGGTWAAMPRGAASPRPGEVTLRIGEPIPTTGMTYEDRDRLAQACHAAIVRLAAGDAGTTPGAA